MYLFYFIHSTIVKFLTTFLSRKGTTIKIENIYNYDFYRTSYYYIIIKITRLLED